MGAGQSRSRRNQQAQQHQQAYPPPTVVQTSPNASGPYNHGSNVPHGGWRNPAGHGPSQPVPQEVPQPQEFTTTATIRNAVNLKKNTLKVTPVPGNPNLLQISFSFDASAACCVSTYVMATEEPVKGCRLTTQRQPSAGYVFYEKGLGHKFPKPGDPTGQQHVIDLSQYPDGVLVIEKDGAFPLVVRLETIADKGIKEGHTLQELRPGDEQRLWVQSQTTYAVLHKEESNMWEPRVQKQKIWVEGISYELQEIYGMEQAGAKPVTEEDLEERLCVICLVNDRDTTVLPCRHMCMCHECAQELRKQTSKCPICRNHVESLLHIKIAGKHGKGSSKPLSASQSAGGQTTQAAGADAFKPTSSMASRPPMV